MMSPLPPPQIIAALRRGLVIPAHPLALNANRKFDEKHQRALTRYYCAAGAGGIAVGVHTTQFQIRDPKFGLYQPVLTLASETIDQFVLQTGKSVVKIAGIVGPTAQAVQEARFAADKGYHLGLVNLGPLHSLSNAELIEHLRAIAEIISIMGFYLNPAIGGRELDFKFWREAAELENLLAIKVAPFNRYQTLEVVRAVAESGRADDIALYTGNDDTIVMDLLSQFWFAQNNHAKTQRIVGGLLGHWAVWTKKAVDLLNEIHVIFDNDQLVPTELLLRAQHVTDANAAFFDAPHNFAGCIAGLHEVLRRQGLMAGRWTLNPDQDLSRGQMEEVDRVYSAYPHLNDDAFVAEHLDRWLQ